MNPNPNTGPAPHAPDTTQPLITVVDFLISFNDCEQSLIIEDGYARLMDLASVSKARPVKIFRELDKFYSSSSAARNGPNPENFARQILEGFNFRGKCVLNLLLVKAVPMESGEDFDRLCTLTNCGGLFPSNIHVLIVLPNPDELKRAVTGFQNMRNRSRAVSVWAARSDFSKLVLASLDETSTGNKEGLALEIGRAHV